MVEIDDERWDTETEQRIMVQSSQLLTTTAKTVKYGGMDRKQKTYRATLTCKFETYNSPICERGKYVNTWCCNRLTSPVLFAKKTRRSHSLIVLANGQWHSNTPCSVMGVKFWKWASRFVVLSYW